MRLVLKSLILSFIIVSSMVLNAYANSTKHSDIDPRLVEIVKTIKAQISTDSNLNSKAEAPFGFNDPFLLSANELISNLYNGDPENIILAAENFKSQVNYDASIDTDFIAAMFINFADELSKKPDWLSVENTALDYLDSDHWFEQFMGCLLYTSPSPRDRG